MSTSSDTSVQPGTALLQFLSSQRVWVASGLILLVLAVFDTEQAIESTVFASTALIGIAPFLIFSIAIAAYANATGADNLIAKAFVGAPAMMIIMGA